MAATPDAFARAVRLRRAELRMSQEDVRRESGLSVTTIGKMERGDPDLSVQRMTLRRLDLALQWAPGTAESWYSGHGGIVTGGPAAADLAHWVNELAPLVAAQLRTERDRSTISVADLPEGVVAALEHLVAEIRTAMRSR